MPLGHMLQTERRIHCIHKHNQRRIMKKQTEFQANASSDPRKSNHSRDFPKQSQTTIFSTLPISGIVKRAAMSFKIVSQLSSSVPLFHALFDCIRAYSHWTCELLQSLQGNSGLDHKAVTGRKQEPCSISSCMTSYQKL